MKKILALMLLIPFASIAADQGGKPMMEHAGKAAEHAGTAAPEGAAAQEAATDAAQEAGAAAAEEADAAAAEGTQQMEKKAKEHAGSPVK